MARISINLPDALYAKVKALADKNADSISTSAKQMIELGLLISEKKSADRSANNSADMGGYCQKTIIESMMLLKSLLFDKMEFSQEKIDAIKGASRRKYAEMLGLVPD